MNGERRQFPRVRGSLPARVHFEEGASSRATLLNISRSGVQIECDIELGLSEDPWHEFVVDGALKA